jgi:hypothetical protein
MAEGRVGVSSWGNCASLLAGRILLLPGLWICGRSFSVVMVERDGGVVLGKALAFLDPRGVFGRGPSYV